MYEGMTNLHGSLNTLNSNNACYHSVQNLLSCLLCININNRAHRTIIFVLLYEFELGLSLGGDGQKLWVLENRVREENICL
jgi:hypothetical protein